MKIYTVTVILRDALGNETHRRRYTNVHARFDPAAGSKQDVTDVLEEAKSFIETMVAVFGSVRVGLEVELVGATPDE